MYYVLNFDTHEFISCDNASVAEASIRSLLASGTAEDSLEVVNGFADESRLAVNEFRAFCEKWNPIDESIVNALLPGEMSAPPLPEFELEVGMVGTIKNAPDIKKDLRGKSFVITKLDEQSIYAACSIDGKPGIYAVAKSHMENVSQPGDKLIAKPSLKNQIQSATARSAESHSSSDVKKKLPQPEL